MSWIFWEFVSLLYPFIIEKILFAHPVEKHALLAGLRGRAMHQRLPFPKGGGCQSPLDTPLRSTTTTTTRASEWQRTRPSSEQPRFEGLGRSMQRHHGNQTRRPPPLPTVHSTAGLAIRVRMQRYLGNGNYPLAKDTFLRARFSPRAREPRRIFYSTLHPHLAPRERKN